MKDRAGCPGRMDSTLSGCIHYVPMFRVDDTTWWRENNHRAELAEPLTFPYETDKRANNATTMMSDSTIPSMKDLCVPSDKP